MASKHIILGLFMLICILQGGETGKAAVVRITDNNWKQTLEGDWLIKFYAPWCPACKAIAPTWKDLSEWSQELDTNIAEVDVTEEPGLSGRFAVTSLPTIFHATDGVFRRYLGPRTKDELITLIEEKKYIEIDPVPGWQSPNSIPMTILSWVFKMSMIVRVTHTLLTEDYGFPAWSSYGFFAVLTVFVGLLLGVILVLIADCFWPVRPHTPSPNQGRAPPTQSAADEQTEGKRKEEEEVEEIDGAGDEGTKERDDQTVRKRKTDPDTTESEKTT